jgi:hypothetical protein
VSRSTPDRAGRRRGRAIASLVVLTTFIVGCQSTASDAPTSSVSVATTPQPTRATTSLPPASTLRGQAVEPCEAGEEDIVSAHVADLGGHLVATSDGVWLSRFGSPEVVHVEAATLCPDATAVVPGADLGVAAMAVGDDDLLYVAAAQTGAVSAIAPGEEVATPLMAEAAGGGGLAVADGRLWAVCCEPSGGVARPSAVFDVASGDIVAELGIEAGSGIEVVGETAWIGRQDAAGVYQVTVAEGAAEVTASQGTGTTTTAVTASPDGVYLVGDEPVLQRWVDGGIEEVAALPFPRERPVDIDVAEDGSVFAVSAFGPGIFWIQADGNAFNLGGAQSLIQVEAAGEWVWTLDTGGVLTRIERAALGRQ